MGCAASADKDAAKPKEGQVAEEEGEEEEEEVDPTKPKGPKAKAPVKPKKAPAPRPTKASILRAQAIKKEMEPPPTLRKVSKAVAVATTLKPHEKTIPAPAPAPTPAPAAVPLAKSASSTIPAPTQPVRSSSNDALASTVVVNAAPVITYTEADFQGFQTMKLLGKGGYGSAYECGLKSCKICCVKIIELGSIDNPSEVTSLRNEIELMKRLQHPNIVQYYGCTEDKTKNTINIFMELVTGGCLNSYIKKFETVPLATARDWTKQIVSGVKYLHDSGIVHRDIKGANLLVTNDGVLKLADFGCSKSIDDVCSKTRGCTTMVGTPYWMAPEVLKCEEYGVKSDIWSIGCTVVEMVTGKPPWPECESMWAAVYKIANSKGLPPNIPKDLPKDMMSFLERCFERTPAKRASIDELLAHTWINSKK